MGNLYKDFDGSRASLAHEYQRASPFPHVVIDDFLPRDVITAMAGEVGAVPEHAERSAFHTQGKSAHQANKFASLGPETLAALGFLSSGPFIRFLENLTGIKGLIADPHYMGGGVHRVKPGGFLKVHTDFTWHQGLKLDRRLNLILYLNDAWEESFGGHLELWDRHMIRCVTSIAPVLNRCCIFSTSDISFHGHPTPLACPDNRARYSIAAYYYTNGRPRGEVWNRHRRHTDYRNRPGEDAVPAKSHRQQVEMWARGVLPEAAFERYAAVRARLRRR